jgi:hypothetical protein
MQRAALFVVVGVCVAGCNTSNEIADFPEDTCEKNVASSIEPVPGVKPSEHLALVERLACFYGMSEWRARVACSIDPDAPEYFGSGRSDTTYGLRDKTAIQLIKAEEYGEQLEHKRTAVDNISRPRPPRRGFMSFG